MSRVITIPITRCSNAALSTARDANWISLDEDGPHAGLLASPTLGSCPRRSSTGAAPLQSDLQGELLSEQAPYVMRPMFAVYDAITVQPLVEKLRLGQLR